MGQHRTAASTAPAAHAVAVTPNDSTTFPVTRALYIGTTGNVAVRMASGVTITFTAVPVGVLPIQVDRVLSTGTTASTILALY
jgi:hypothetical protein